MAQRTAETRRKGSAAPTEVAEEDGKEPRPSLEIKRSLRKSVKKLVKSKLLRRLFRVRRRLRKKKKRAKGGGDGGISPEAVGAASPPDADSVPDGEGRGIEETQDGTVPGDGTVAGDDHHSDVPGDVSPSGRPGEAGQAYTVHHHGKRVEELSLLYDKSHSVPQLVDSPQSQKSRGEVGEIDNEHIKKVKQIVGGESLQRGHSVPRILHSSSTPKSKAEVGEIDKKNIKKVKELAELMTNLSAETQKLNEKGRVKCSAAAQFEGGNRHAGEVRKVPLQL